MSRTAVRTAYLRVSIEFVGAFLLFAAPESRGQESATVVARELPDFPAPQSQQPTEPPKSGVTSTVVGYMTNRSLFFPDIATSPGPLTSGQKFKLFLNESVSPSSFLMSAASAGFSQWRDSPHDYGQGAEGYGKRFGASMARGASESFFGSFLAASVLHQDPRFFPQYHPSFWGSIKYSARRIVVTRNDAGRDVFDASGLFGPLAGETLANVYLPRSEQTGAKTLERYGSDLAWRFAGNMFKNYWPTLFKDLGLNHLGVIPAPTTVPATDPRNGY
jgi:hypothetical protein